jgi:hypothetical protein
MEAILFVLFWVGGALVHTLWELKKLPGMHISDAKKSQ